MSDADGGAPKVILPLGRVNGVDIFADEAMPKGELDPAYAEQQLRGLREMTDLLNKQAAFGIQRNKAQELQPADTPIGSKLSATEYASALEKVGGATVGMIGQAWRNTDYTGKIIQFSDTHVVQQVSKNVAIAHDIKTLTNGADLLKQAVAGNVQGKTFNVHYGNSAGITLPSTQPIKDKPATVLALAPQQPTKGMKR